jgi:hypothetical protein
MKSYEVFKDNIFLEKAESILEQIPPYPIYTNFSLNNGASAIGQVYLEAKKFLNHPTWEQRADWIMNLFYHCFQDFNQSQGYWQMEPDNIVTADLYVGMSGIIHYLMRYLYPSEINHLLWPSSRHLE